MKFPPITGYNESDVAYFSSSTKCCRQNSKTSARLTSVYLKLLNYLHILYTIKHLPANVENLVNYNFSSYFSNYVLNF